MGQIQGSASDIVLKQDIVDLVYPVGSYYWSSISTNPAIVFGGGTWVQVKDVFLYAAGDTAPTNVADYVGGEKEHTLTVDEMPKHNFKNLYWNNTQFGLSNYINKAGYQDGTRVLTVDDIQTAGENVNPHTEFIGNAQPFNILPPFITAFCWRRVA